jgi:hypothetical protein
METGEVIIKEAVGLEEEPQLFKAVFGDFGEVEEIKANAWSNLARDENGNLLPHCFVLKISGGEIRNFFEVVKQSHWVLECWVFKTVRDLERWVRVYGEDRVIEKFYV